MQKVTHLAAYGGVVLQGYVFTEADPGFFLGGGCTSKEWHHRWCGKKN